MYSQQEPEVAFLPRIAAEPARPPGASDAH
jgi:hypothetical protein